MSTSLFSAFGILIFLITMNFVNAQTNIDSTILIASGIFVIFEFFRTVLASVSRGYKPQFEQYGFIIFEIIKIPAALILIFYLDMGLLGVILSSAIASLASICLLLITTYEKIQGKINLAFLKKWMKLFWIPIYLQLRTIINQSDILIFTAITGSVTGVAYWSIANAVSALSRHSTRINVGLYPKLLAGGKKEYFQENLIRMLYFAFPLAAMSLTFSEPALHALNPLYKVAAPVIIFLVPYIFLVNLTKLFRSALSGIEKVDINEKATFLDYMKSKLFFIPTIINIQRLLYVVILSGILLFLTPTTESNLDLVIIWSIITLFTQIPLTLYLYHLIRKEFSLKIDIKTIMRYLLICIGIFAVIHLVMNEFLIYHESIFDFLPEFLPYIAITIISYLGITYVTDKKTRILFKSIINEIKSTTHSK